MTKSFYVLYYIRIAKENTMEQRITISPTNEQYSSKLLDNLQSAIDCFKKQVETDGPSCHVTYVQKLNTQLESLSTRLDKIAQSYRSIVFDDGEITTVRGDNKRALSYTERYDKVLNEKNKVQAQLNKINLAKQHVDILDLLKKIFTIHLKIDELQQIINWQESAEYASVNRYERDDDEYDKYNTKQRINQYANDKEGLIKKVLQYPEMKKYLDIIIAQEQKQKIVNSKTPTRAK